MIWLPFNKRQRKQGSAVVEKPKAKVEETYDDAFEEIIVDDDDEEEQNKYAY